MEYQTRRERREAERAAEQSSEAEQVSYQPAQEIDDSPSTPQLASEFSVPSDQGAEPGEPDSKPLTRRQLRDLNSKGKLDEDLSRQRQSGQQITSSESASPKISEIPTEHSHATQTDIENANQGSSEEPDQLTGKSYIYQESSNTFTLDAIPDSLSNNDSESIITNSESIAVVTDSQPSFASDMDDLRFDMEDHQDTVAGKISLVDPVSARMVADAREPEIVVPGKIVVRNRMVSIGFGVLATVMFVAAGIGLWWVLTEMDVFSL